MSIMSRTFRPLPFLGLFLLALSSGCATQHAGEGSKGIFSTSSYCADHTKARHADAGPAEASAVNKEFAEFRDLVAQSLTYRQETIRLADYLSEKGRQNQAFNGDDMEALNLGTQAHLALRKKLYALAEAHECWLDDPAAVPEPSRLPGVMLSLAAALTLYDNYLLAISAVENDAKLRRFLNRPDSGYQKNRAELDSVTSEFNSISNRQRVRKAMQFYESEMAKLPPARLNDPMLAYLSGYLQASPSYGMVRQYAPFAVLGKKVEFMGTLTADVLSGLQEEGMNLFSMLFGNATGMVATRHGKLYDQPTLAERIRGELRAGDILLEKTPFRLTDKFIPGFWGHAAVWVGNEQELKELGIWDDPVVQKYHKQIREGHRVVEALRTGVTMNSLEHFMNIDDMGVLRQKDLPREERAAVVIRALRQVGKGYNFNFDVEATDKVVCSGLVYLAYAKLPWDSDKTLGRVTFSPDQVAAKALAGGPLDVAVFIHDGTWVESDQLQVMTRLMIQEGFQAKN